MIKFNEVTWYSKLAAVIFFLIILPVITFSIGVQYEKTKESIGTGVPEINVINQREDIMTVSKKVLDALERKDYDSLEKLSSSAGLSFNEVPNLDLSKNDIAKEEISNIPNNKNIYLFGYTDGKGDPINLTIKEYFDKWIYNHDYKNAPEVGLNKVLDGGSNVMNTILADAGNRTVVAFHFDGSEQYAGMDWTTLYLVFDLKNSQYKLRGIAKNNWTI